MDQDLKPMYVRVHEAFVAGYSKKEIAEAMGRPVQVVHSALWTYNNIERVRKVQAANRAANYVPRRRESVMRWRRLDAILIAMWHDGWSAQVIADSQSFRQERVSRNAIIGRIRRLRAAGQLDDAGRETTLRSGRQGEAFTRPEVREAARLGRKRYWDKKRKEQAEKQAEVS